MKAAFHVVIPARYASTRLPGKPLADLGGQPMIVRVVGRAARSGAASVIVASDDERVIKAVRDAGGAACLTRADHPSGSDRVMEVAEANAWPDDAIIVNVQGDEPLLPPAVVGQVAGLLAGGAGVDVATLHEPIQDYAEVFDPNVVKVVEDANGRARYFSRAPIPYHRAWFADGPPSGPVPDDAPWRRHVGIYAYRVGALRRFVDLPPGRLEGIESLEQLRLLENGLDICIAAAIEAVPGGVDTPEDLARVRRQLMRADDGNPW